MSLTRRALDALTDRWIWHPRPVEAVPVTAPADLPRLPRGRALTFVSWNLQFCGGRARRFFYDGGRDVSVPTPEVRATCAAIADALRTLDADVALLQEVDRGSRRTGGVDQAAELAAHGDWPAIVTTPYFRARYVPVPTHEPLGRMDMHLVALSRFAVARARRHALAPLREPWLRQQFNLKRAVLELGLPIHGGGELAAFDVHLSAFSRGDGTLDRQVAQCDALAADAAAAGRAVWVAGDFNALAPGDDPRRLPDPDEYAEAVSPVAPLIARWRTPWSPDTWRDGRFDSYLPPGAAAPDRILDWVFHDDRVVVERFEVDRRFGDLSDHLPLVARLRLR